MMGLKHFEGDPSELQNALEPIRNEFINSWLSNTAIWAARPIIFEAESEIIEYIQKIY